jgi:hypothetical protein
MFLEAVSHEPAPKERAKLRAVPSDAREGGKGGGRNKKGRRSKQQEGEGIEEKCKLRAGKVAEAVYFPVEEEKGLSSSRVW